MKEARAEKINPRNVTKSTSFTFTLTCSQQRCSVALALREQCEGALRVEYIFKYSGGAAIGIQIAYSAWFTLYMTCVRTYSRILYTHKTGYT